MEICEVTKGKNREGYDRYYISIKNKRGKIYLVFITINGKKIIEFSGTCMFWVWEISRKIKTHKYCRHVKFAISYLKEKGIINE